MKGSRHRCVCKNQVEDVSHENHVWASYWRNLPKDLPSTKKLQTFFSVSHISILKHDNFQSTKCERIRIKFARSTWKLFSRIFSRTTGLADVWKSQERIQTVTDGTERRDSRDNPKLIGKSMEKILFGTLFSDHRKSLHLSYEWIIESQPTLIKFEISLHTIVFFYFNLTRHTLKVWKIVINRNLYAKSFRPPSHIGHETHGGSREIFPFSTLSLSLRHIKTRKISSHSQLGRVFWTNKNQLILIFIFMTFILLVGKSVIVVEGLRFHTKFRESRDRKNFKIALRISKLTCTRDSVNPILIAISSLMKMSTRRREKRKKEKLENLMNYRSICHPHLDNESCWNISQVRSTELA